MIIEIVGRESKHTGEETQLNRIDLDGKDEIFYLCLSAVHPMPEKGYKERIQLINVVSIIAVACLSLQERVL